MRGAAAGDKPPKVRICRLDGCGVTWRITYLLDPRRKAKGPARHELLSRPAQIAARIRALFGLTG